MWPVKWTAMGRPGSCVNRSSEKATVVFTLSRERNDVDVKASKCLQEIIAINLTIALKL